MMLFLPIIEYDRDYMIARATLQSEKQEAIDTLRWLTEIQRQAIERDYERCRVALVHEFYQHRGQPERT